MLGSSGAPSEHHWFLRRARSRSRRRSTTVNLSEIPMAEKMRWKLTSMVGLCRGVNIKLVRIRRSGIPWFSWSSAKYLQLEQVWLACFYAGTHQTFWHCLFSWSSAKYLQLEQDFWWTGVKEDATARSLCLREWADICIEKEVRGLGVRNLQAMNQRLILSAAWRLAKEPHSQLALILKVPSRHFHLESRHFHLLFGQLYSREQRMMDRTSLVKVMSSSPALWDQQCSLLPTLQGYTFSVMQPGRYSKELKRFQQA